MHSNVLTITPEQAFSNVYASTTRVILIPTGRIDFASLLEGDIIVTDCQVKKDSEGSIIFDMVDLYVMQRRPRQAL